MMYKILVCLVFAHGVFGEVVINANLRGHTSNLEKRADAVPNDISGKELHSHQTEILKNHENSMHELIRKLRKEGMDKGTKIFKESVLSVPDVSYRDYIVERRRIDTDCNSPVASLVVRNVGCLPSGPGHSYQTVCRSSTEFDTYYYSSSDCTGPPYSHHSNSFGSEPCYQGVGWQCVSHDGVPEFAEKEGLNTYKFRDFSMCTSFAYNVLGFWPDYTSDEVLMDDDYFYFPEGNFDDDSTTPCCMPNEVAPPNVGVSDTCPYPLCEFNNGEEGGGNIPMRRQLSSQAVKADTASSAVKAPAFVRPAEWWKSKAKTAYVMNAMKVQTVPSDAYYREYSLSQQRSNVCVFDEKYKLWVKTSCHDQQDTLVYHIYADDQCRALIKKVSHRLRDVIPHYGMCVPSVKSDGKVALTVCHTKNGGVPSGGYGGLE